MHIINHIKVAVLAIAMAGFINCNKADTKDMVSPPAKDTAKKYLALGDSYTIGQGVPAASSFPLQTAQWLQEHGTVLTATDIIAATGWTCFDLSRAIYTRNPTADYSAVTLLIGVNDQYTRRDTTGYRNSFSSLLATAVTLAGNRPSRVFVLSIPDYSVTPFAAYGDTAAIRIQLDAFNAINREVTLHNNCRYLNITPSSRQARYDPSLLAADSLHPSAKEYRKWAEDLGPMLLQVLN